MKYYNVISDRHIRIGYNLNTSELYVKNQDNSESIYSLVPAELVTRLLFTDIDVGEELESFFDRAIDGPHKKQQL